VIPAAFEYFAPRSLDDAIRLLERHGDEAKLLAGGHSLLPLMKLRLAAPRYVIDIGKLSGLAEIKSENRRISIGALATHAQIEHSQLLRSACPLLPETAAEIGDVQVRNCGTVGGSLAHADPAADYPAAILALDAELVAVSSSGARTISAVTFFVEMLTTALRPGEILTEIRVPATASPRSGVAYVKMHQPASGFAVVGVAVRLSLNAKSKLEAVAVGVTGVAPTPYRAAGVEKLLLGRKPDSKSLNAAARKAADGVEVLSDIHASATYRREMAAVLTARALQKALGRAARRGDGRR
jgi:carbon-monoxide dehydrogenase medium subunit